MRDAKEFKDYRYWVSLSDKHLPQFRFPGTSVACDPDMMILWLHRLGFTKKDYLKMTGFKRIEQFIERNPGWPFRAWLGEVLEMREELS